MKRNLQYWSNFEQFSYQSLDTFFNIQHLKSGVHSIQINSNHLDFLIIIKENTPILYGFHGAQTSRENRTPPFFEGLNLTKELNATTCFFSDPCLNLNDDLKLAWFAGDKQFNTQKTITKVIKKINQLLSPSFHLFWGPSGGGFASLFFASHIENSTALVWNPQTNIDHYVPEFVENFNDFCFSKAQYTSCRKSPIPQNNCKIIYLQNNNDWHVQKHMTPYLSNFLPAFDFSSLSQFSGHITQSIYLHLDRWGNGHAVPPVSFLRILLEHILKPNFNFNTQQFIKPLINYSFENRIILKLENNFLSAEILTHTLNPDATFAFYLCLNGQKKEVIWYNKSNKAKFKANLTEGKWHIRGFIKINKTVFPLDSSIIEIPPLSKHFK